MRNPSRLLTWMLCLGGALPSAAGCSSLGNSTFKLSKPFGDDPHPKRMARQDAVIKDFEIRRNQAQFMAAEAARSRDDDDNCRTNLESILHRDPQYRDALLLLAELELERADAFAAIELLQRADIGNTNDAEVQYRLGVALEAAGRHVESVERLQAAVKLEPADRRFADALARAGGAPIATDEASPVPEPVTPPSTAVAEDAAPTNIAPAVEPATSQPEELRQAEQALSAGRRQEARDLLAQLLAADPRHIDANILQAEIELEDGAADAACERIELLVIRHPDSPQVRRACGLVYEATGQTERAQALFAQADTLEQNGELTSSEDVELAEVSSEPTPQVVRQSNAIEPLGPQQPSRAKTSNRTASGDRLHPQTAKATIDTTAEDMPDVTETPENATDTLQAAVTALTTGNVAQARSHCLAFVKKSSAGSEAFISVAVEALKYEQPALAEELSALGLKQFPRSAGLHRLRGTALYRVARYDAAEAELRRSVALDNTQALSYFLLGSVQTRLGKTSEADWNMRQAARLDHRYARRP